MTGSRIGPALHVLVRWLDPATVHHQRAVVAAILYDLAHDTTQLYGLSGARQPVREAFGSCVTTDVYCAVTVFTIIGTFALNHGVSLLKPPTRGSATRRCSAGCSLRPAWAA